MTTKSKQETIGKLSKEYYTLHKTSYKRDWCSMGLKRTKIFGLGDLFAYSFHSNTAEGNV